jgi:hypothetical protein
MLAQAVIDHLHSNVSHHARWTGDMPEPLVDMKRFRSSAVARAVDRGESKGRPGCPLLANHETVAVGEPGPWHS